jgi:hypothetical protein
MTKINIEDVEIYDNDRCPGGMRYLQDLSHERLHELLRSARNEPDRDTHFTAFVSGREAEFVLIRRGEGEYELAPGSY